MATFVFKGGKYKGGKLYYIKHSKTEQGEKHTQIEASKLVHKVLMIHNEEIGMSSRDLGEIDLNLELNGTLPHEGGLT